MRNFVILSAAVAASAANFSVEDAADVSAEIAVEAALDPFRTRKPAATVCENCRGTGRIGDGNVVYDCPVCGGDGKKVCEGEPCLIR